MNWDDLRVFEAAASNGSLSAGAKALGLSQPQMSRRLRDLEAVFGVRLFDRTPQGLRPTAAGAKLIPLTNDMRAVADQVARIAPELSATTITCVRLAVDEIRERFLISHLACLRQALGDITLEIFSDHQHPDHESRKTDVQIRSCLPDSETLVAKRLGETAYGLYAHKALAKDLGSPSADRELLALPYIDLSPDQLWYPVQKRWLESNMTGPPALRVNTMTAMLNAALAAQGVALLPRFVGCDEADLIELTPDTRPPSTTEYLIAHRDVLRDRAVRKVVDEITQLYRSNKQRLAPA